MCRFGRLIGSMGVRMLALLGLDWAEARVSRPEAERRADREQSQDTEITNLERRLSLELEADVLRRRRLAAEQHHAADPRQ